MNILVVIPARGGSKGIPRKNIRDMNGKPLIAYAIDMVNRSMFNPDVYVSSDDDEILFVAKMCGAKLIKRDSSISDDKTTLDPVIYDALIKAEQMEKKRYDVIATVQATSPLLTTKSFDSALKDLINSSDETVISGVDVTHLTWSKVGEKYLPNYVERKNRQELTPIIRETGGFLITKRHVISENNRISDKVFLKEIPNSEAIDIDSYEDWNLCEYYLKRKRILFVVAGYKEIGLGHAFNSFIVSQTITAHEVFFLVTKESDLAYEYLRAMNLRVVRQGPKENLSNSVLGFSPDLVINDILDTDYEYVHSLKENGIRVLNFEDLGIGAVAADVVINAIYPEKRVIKNHFYGPDFFCLREEFFLFGQKKITNPVKKVLLTYGGVDPAGLTLKTLSAISPYCAEKGISITVIVGPGNRDFEAIQEKARELRMVEALNHVKNISEYMFASDIVFTSAGRTTYEIASIGVPAIVICQNKRELSHFFASSEYGFINLGLHEEVADADITTTLKELCENAEQREYMHQLMIKTDLRGGKNRVKSIIEGLVE